MKAGGRKFNFWVIKSDSFLYQNVLSGVLFFNLRKTCGIQSRIKFMKQYQEVKQSWTGAEDFDIMRIF